ncbi:MAG: Hpt sensor hybrid histidine kinase, partial [Massilia sp.]|nr:Hpt sensor hybrid histidine kinase [Massilia sp.]
KFGGTGLGLSICRRLLTLMGGMIRVESISGQGSKFVIELRLPRGSALPVAPLPAALEGVSVLVVDDNQTSLQILRQQLEGWRMRVVCAQDGGAALRLMAQAARDAVPFDIAILDLQMPGMDGLQLARTIQAQPELKRTCLMTLTGICSNTNQQILREAGILNYVNKPIRRAELLRVVSSVLAEAAVPLPRMPEPGQVPLIGGTVLLVEDNPINQEVGDAMLAKLGLQMSLAHNGRQALALMRERDFDLVLMDCQMPVMDGYEAAAAIRQLHSGRSVRLPIIALTANAMPGVEQRCRDAGMDDFLAKPYTLGQLGAALAKWLPAMGPAPHRRPPEARTDQQDTDLGAPINAATLELLRELDPGGGTGLIKHLLQTFLVMARQGVSDVEDAIGAGDAKALSRAAHGLKSGTANVGALALSAHYSRLEKLGTEHNMVAARALLATIRQEHERAVLQVHEIMEVEA